MNPNKRLLTSVTALLNAMTECNHSALQEFGNEITAVRAAIEPEPTVLAERFAAVTSGDIHTIGRIQVALKWVDVSHRRLNPKCIIVARGPFTEAELQEWLEQNRRAALDSLNSDDQESSIEPTR